jgi:hypothetical protein
LKKIGEFELPKILYKYRDWNLNNHKRILLHQELYFASPKNFNDPFDCKIPLRFDIEPEKYLVGIYSNVIKAVYPDADEKRIQEFANNQAKNGPVKPSKLKKQGKEYFDDLDKRIGIFSFTKIPDDILMWGHHSNGHSGFCVGLKTDELLKLDSIDFVGKVEYLEKYPVIIPNHDLTDHFRQQIFSKSSRWDYEKEYRMTKNHIKNRKIKIPQSAYSEVIFGCLMNEKEKGKILKLVEKKLPHIKVFQAEVNIDKFELNIEKL